MTREPFDLVIVGPRLETAACRHASTFRALLQGLRTIGHRVDYVDVDDEQGADGLQLAAIRAADAVVVVSCVADAARVGDLVTREATGVTALYDTDTPVTLDELLRGAHATLSAALIPAFDLYLSSTGGPTLDRLERELGARRALPLYCAVDADRYLPTRHPKTTAIGYLGTFSADRKERVRELLLDVAAEEPDRFFAIGGPGYPDAHTWPRNVLWRPHVPAEEHLAFYGQQRFTLNVTRGDRKQAGWSPSVRLFEAAACGTPILTDNWEGLEAFFRPGHEVLVVESTDDVLRVLRDTKEERRLELGAAARRRVFAEHTAVHRAQELTQYLVAAGQWGPASVDRPGLTDSL